MGWTMTNDLPADATGEALRRLVEEGSDLGRPMDVEFFVSVPSEAAGAEVSQRAAELGFATEVAHDDATDSWTCYCRINLIPSYDHVTSVEAKLDALAEDVGGYSDGFGSYGNAHCP